MSASDEQAIDILIHAIVEYNNATGWEAAQAIVEAKQKVLLSSSADVIYEILIVAAKSEAEAKRLTVRRIVLGLCRAAGIATAFRRARERFGNVF